MRDVRNLDRCGHPIDMSCDGELEKFYVSAANGRTMLYARCGRHPIPAVSFMTEVTREEFDVYVVMAS